MITQKGLDRLVKGIWKKYFPESKRHIKIIFEDDHFMMMGQVKNRHISIATCFQTSGVDRLEALVIHEICHLGGKMYHGPRWRQEMERVAWLAENLDWPNEVLAQNLRKDISNYERREYDS